MAINIFNNLKYFFKEITSILLINQRTEFYYAAPLQLMLFLFRYFLSTRIIKFT